MHISVVQFIRRAMAGAGLVMACSVQAQEAIDGYLPDPTAYILPTGKASSTTTWRYTHSTPASNWTATSFSDGSWKTGAGGFGLGGEPGDVLRTAWEANASDIWMRRKFTVQSGDIASLILWGRWDDTIEIYINGVKAASTFPRETDEDRQNAYEGWSERYRYLAIRDAARQAIVAGENTIAVHVKDYGGGKYADVGLARSPMVNMPVSGSVPSSLQPLSDSVRNFMIKHAIPGGVFAVLRENKLVAQQGFGYKNKALTTAMPANAILRLASADKNITKVGIHRLIASGAVDPVTRQPVTLNTPVVPLLKNLGIQPLSGSTPDSRMNQITIQHILDHNSGLADWGDAQELYTQTGTTASTYRIQHGVRWMISQSQLQFTPGELELVDGQWVPRFEYRSSPYMMLRYLTQALAGGDYIKFLRESVFGPAGSSDVIIAYQPLEQRNTREPWYAAGDTHDRSVGLEHYLALATSAEAYVRMARHWDIEDGHRFIDPVSGLWQAGTNIDRRRGAGQMAGTWSFAINRLTDQTTFIVIFNISGFFDPLIDGLDKSTIGWSDASFGLKGPAVVDKPVPNDGVKNVSLTPTLAWGARTNAKYDVYFGTTFPLSRKVSGSTSTTYKPSTLKANTLYFWRVDTIDSNGTRTGTHRSFRTRP